MACPFARRGDSLPRQLSATESNTSLWAVEDDLSDLPDDALTLTHLQMAIQLLTAPSVNMILSTNFHNFSIQINKYVSILFIFLKFFCIIFSV